MKTIVSILMIFCFIIIFSCKENNGIPTCNDNNILKKISDDSVNDEIIELGNKLDILARNLAFALNNENVLEKLRYVMFNADNDYKILKLEKWMLTEINGKTIAQRMAESGLTAMINGKETKVSADLFLTIVREIKSGVDFYFPIKEHRTNWFENRKNLLIASVNIADEWSSIKAYSLLGQMKVLDPNTPTPKTEPVLVIIQCEHHGIHRGNLNVVMEETTPPGDGGGGSGGGYPQPWKFYLDYMNIHDDSEPIYAEPAEIYLKVRYIEENYWQETDTPWDDQDGQEYPQNYPDPVCIFSSYNWGDSWNVEVWEADGELLGSDDHLEDFTVYQSINTGITLHGENGYVDCRFTR